MNVVDTIMEMFARGGGEAYFGEVVTQQEHALQTAHCAVAAGAGDALVAAALLHDIGHLLGHLDQGLPENSAEQGIDDRHEARGAKWLAHYFGPTVTEPIHMHVAAKRYLCAVDPTYLGGLSPASQRSLQLQGGPFTPNQVHAFERAEHHAAAVHLRRWDDEAKVPGRVVPPLESYRGLLQRLVARRGA